MILLLAGTLLLDVGAPTSGFDPARCGILRTLTPMGGDVYRVAFRPDGRMLAAGFQDGTVRMYDTATWREAAKWEASEGGVQALAWSADGKTLATGGPGLVLKLWDPETRRLQASHGDPTGGARIIAFSRDGRWLAAAGQGGSLGVWDRVTGGSHVINAHPMAVTAMAFTRDGKSLISSDMSGGLIFHATEDGKTLRTLKSSGGYVTAMALSSNNRLLVTCASGSKELSVWDVEKGRVTQSLKGPTQATRAVAFLRGGRTIAVAGADMGVWLGNVSTGRMTGPLRHHMAALNDVAVHPGGRLFVTSAHDRKIKVWGILPPGVAVDRPPGFCGITVSPGPGGVVVSKVHPGTGAERGGFAAGDVVVAVGGVEVETTDEAIDQISSRLSGDTLQFTILRGGARRTLTVTLTERPEFKK